MPRPIKWPPTILHHKKSGQDRIRVNGIDYYLGPHGSQQAKEEYARLVAKLAAEGKAGPAEKRPDTPAGITVADVLAAWDRHAVATLSKRGRQVRHYRNAYEPLARLFGDTLAAQFDARKLRALQQAMLDGSWMDAADRMHPVRPKTGGWSRGVVNRRIVAIRTIWRWAEEESQLVPPGSWSALRAVSPIRRNRPGAREVVARRSTTLAEVRLVCRRLTPVGRALLLFQWWTGCRSGEHRIMRASDVDTTGEVWLYRPREHKTDYLGHDRVIAIGRKAQSILRPWLIAAQQVGPDAAVFPSPGSGRARRKRRGEPYTQDGYCQLIHRAARAAGVDGFHGYLCRHATRMRVSRTHGDEAARSYLGQRHLDTALRYGCLDHDLASEVARKTG